MMAIRLVAASGIGVNIQRLMQIVATPKHFIPAALKPEGGGRTISSKPRRVRRSINPRLRVCISGWEGAFSGIVTAQLIRGTGGSPSGAAWLITEKKVEVKPGGKDLRLGFSGGLW
jgi:hypothetical protein